MPQVILNNKYNVSEIVYLKTDPDQFAWIIVNILVSKDDNFTYICKLGEVVGTFEEFELVPEKILFDA